jgi:hypothetical protein
LQVQKLASEDAKSLIFAKSVVADFDYHPSAQAVSADRQAGLFVVFTMG